MTVPDFGLLEVGEIVASSSYTVSRADLVRYAGASLDFNPIHWNERFAREVGLDGVIAHGMFTMGTAVNVVVDWAEDPARVVDYQVRFTRPVPVADAANGSPEQPTATIDVEAKVGALDQENRVARIDLRVSVDGATVLAKSQAKVRL
ncbi:MaoC/PaaZ C-terminal domain-containing protein [Saxibacter everestensis]|uniref:MaoC/PaaZ C-terminal domain-containing protein n=1 Tax=Saxibacter everestensis TaxID=2909229 RepID=A0ABY8QPM8_9MICO|nr:MaoC/PaaZ C-terminal domain-containing protein [Brevibacteriaceae bacterium ZFBP1038]